MMHRLHFKGILTLNLVAETLMVPSLKRNVGAMKLCLNEERNVRRDTYFADNEISFYVKSSTCQLMYYLAMQRHHKV